MGKNYKLISYFIVFITLFIYFGNVIYAGTYTDPRTFVEDLLKDIDDKYYQVDVEGSGGFVIPRLYA